MITEALQRIANERASLTREEARAVMTEVFSGSATDAQIAGLLVALHMKGETVEEIVGFAEAMRTAAEPLPRHQDSTLDVSTTGRDVLVDTCGTGGDARGTFNISTATAFVVAGAGVRVAKHGNRSLSSKCGSADVMEALGVKISLPTAVLGTCLEEVGIVFLFAPTMHTAMKYVQPARRELRLRTIFNLLGRSPIRQSFGAGSQVYSRSGGESRGSSCMLGAHRALVVHSLDGLDEITITGRPASQCATATFAPMKHAEEFGQTGQLEDISGGDAPTQPSSARFSPEIARDVVLLNASAALVASGRAEHLRNLATGGSPSIPAQRLRN
jgi:anthranilate phosphoribosyltransferase